MKGRFNHQGVKSVVLCLSLAALALSAQAQIVTLSDNNSVARVDTGSAAGMFDWSVQGQNQLAQQWFWYRVGNAANAPINTISAPAITLFAGTRGLTTLYANAHFSVRIDYLLSGGAPVGAGQLAVSDISETITIQNHSGTALDFHFFQYSDFDLGGLGNDLIQLGRNLRGLWNEASQTDPLAGLTETVTTPGANRGEAALFNSTLVNLNSGTSYDLNDAGGPVGPGDATWALQWDLSIAPGGSALISKDKYLQVIAVPEPSALALGGLGLVLFFLRRRA